jgi:hypothetical protein
MSRGLSARQRQVLATLVVAKRPLDVTRELGPLVGMPETDSGRRSLLRAVRLLAQRGLVEITRQPAQGWPAVLAQAAPGAIGELRAPDWQRASSSVVRDERKRARQRRRPKSASGYRGKSHPPTPAGVGLETVIDNTSRYPDAEVIPLVEFAIEGIDMRGVHIKIKNRSRGVSGTAYRAVPEIARVAPDMLYLAIVRIGPPESFPVAEHRYGYTEPGPRNQFPLITLADWQEGLVGTAAHEAMHIQQYKSGWSRSELQTSWHEAEALERYRQESPRGNG